MNLLKPTQWYASLNIYEPLRWRNPRCVYVESLFGGDLPDERIDQIFGVMMLCPQHIFMLKEWKLKRVASYLNRGLNEIVVNVMASGKRERFGVENPAYNRIVFLERITSRDYMRAFREQPERQMKDWPPRWPLPNVWIVAEAGDQDVAEARVPLLLKCNAAMRVLDVQAGTEFDLDKPRCEIHDRDFVKSVADFGEICTECAAGGSTGEMPGGMWLGPCSRENKSGIGWVRIFNHDQPLQKPCYIEHVRSVVQQCKKLDVPVCVLNLGSDVRTRCLNSTNDTLSDNWLSALRVSPANSPVRYVELRSRKGSDPREWPKDIQVQEIPNIEADV